MSNLSQEDIENVVGIIKKFQDTEKMIVFNGDKQKLFNSIARIEAKLEQLNCGRHATKMDKFEEDVTAVRIGLEQNKTYIEKVKTTSLMSMFALITSLVSVVGTLASMTKTAP